MSAADVTSGSKTDMLLEDVCRVLKQYEDFLAPQLDTYEQSLWMYLPPFAITGT